MVKNNNVGIITSDALDQFVTDIRADEGSEVYETLMLMILHDGILEALEQAVKRNLKVIQPTKKPVMFEVSIPSDFQKAVDAVCKSRIFTQTFTKQEIERKRSIALNIFMQLTLRKKVSLFGEEITTVFSHSDFFLPKLSHKTLSENGIKKINLTFSEGTSLNEIVAYLKNTLDVKNNPKKRKLSLGQGLRLLKIEREIRANKSKDAHNKAEYIEQIIAREIAARFKETLSVEATAKALVRIKKVRKEINMPGDK